jgi:hypothetical protein
MFVSSDQARRHKGQFVCIEGFGQLTALVVEAVGTYGVGLSLFAQRTASRIMEVRRVTE